jgi:ankyrin repeat protein
MLASQQGHTALVELLLDSKADPNLQDKRVI